MILAFVEHTNGQIEETGLEMLTAAHQLATALGSTLEAAAFGSGVDSLNDILGAYGVSKCHHVEAPGLVNFAPEAWAQVLVDLTAQQAPAAVLAAGSDRGAELLAHVAARTDQAMAANCFEIQPDGDAFNVKRIRWGGSLHEVAVLRGETKLITIAPHVLAAQPAATPHVTEIIDFSPEINTKDLRVQVESQEAAESGVTLTSARIVVSGGRGVGSPEGFAPLEELADLLKGAIGCSRVVTNNGWRPHSDQVGQTGARVAPELYIASGISGAIQHWVGCMGSKKILVVNTDPEAPIIARSDYAVIGDLHEILPAVSAVIRRRRS
jgi:electron transfer flavoprotein alpha subunit